MKHNIHCISQELYKTTLGSNTDKFRGCLLEEKVMDHLWREVWILPQTRLLQLIHVQRPLSRLTQIQQLQ